MSDYFTIKSGDLVRHEETNELFFVCDVRRTSVEYGGDWVSLLNLETNEHTSDRLGEYALLIPAEKVAKIAKEDIYNHYLQENT